MIDKFSWNGYLYSLFPECKTFDARISNRIVRQILQPNNFNLEPNVVGGTPTIDDEFPYMVSFSKLYFMEFVNPTQYDWHE